MKIRINNLEFKRYTSTKKDKPLYEIVQWYPNIYFGKEQEYRDNGYTDNFEGWGLTKNGSIITIDKSFFTTNPELCFVIAFIEKGSEDWELRSVGERLLELTPEEWEDFYLIFKLGKSKLNKL
jgi:hypothetical protein